MKAFLMIMWTAVGIYLLLYFILLILTKKPIKTMVLTAVIGWWCLAIIELTSFYTGLHLPINVSTVSVSGLMGLPGVVLLEIMKYLIFI
ncbi:MAG: pro-sigmaK processing inhibitor BofA family protein [Acutalibacteraceae bacterium]|nr:pro-sigmaK processing inhibitor BofA family protein [Acutalibacteraceae bacterium]